MSYGKQTALTADQRKQLADRHARVCHYGNPDYVDPTTGKKMGYADSGIWEFWNHVKTFDSHDVDNPIKPLPVNEKTYLKALTLFALACPVLFVPKSRQIMISWWLSGMCAWLARLAPKRRVVWQSQKEEDAQDMVSKGQPSPSEGRIDHIEQWLPKALQDPNIINGPGNGVGRLAYTPTQRYNGVKVPWHGSVIKAVAQGSKQVRGKTPSAYVSDEAAFQEEFGAAVGAILPAIRGGKYLDGRGGKFLAASTIDQGYFVDAVLEPDDDGVVVWDNPIPESIQWWFPRGLPRGMRSRRTPAGIWVLEVHYSADPAKDPRTPEGRAWVQDQLQGQVGGMNSPDWRREYEIDYDAKGGNPVYPFLIDIDCEVFSPKVSAEHAGKTSTTSKYYGCYDYGSTNPSSFGVWEFDGEKKAYKVWELHEPCVNLVEHAKKIKGCPYWEKLEWSVADPSIWANTQQVRSGKQSIADLFAEQGIRFRKGNRDVDVPVAKLFQSVYWGEPSKPKVYITDACPNTRREYCGLRWAEQSSAVAKHSNRPESIMQKDNHAVDADSYLFDLRPLGYIAKVHSPGPGTFGAAERELDVDEALAKCSGGIVCL